MWSVLTDAWNYPAFGVFVLYWATTICVGIIVAPIHAVPRWRNLLFSMPGSSVVWCLAVLGWMKLALLFLLSPVYLDRWSPTAAYGAGILVAMVIALAIVWGLAKWLSYCVRSEDPYVSFIHGIIYAFAVIGVVVTLEWMEKNVPWWWKISGIIAFLTICIALRWWQERWPRPQPAFAMGAGAVGKGSAPTRMQPVGPNANAPMFAGEEPNKLRYWIQRADFSSTDHDPVSLSQAEDLVLNYDWGTARAFMRALERSHGDNSDQYCPPGIGFVANDYTVLHICPQDDGTAQCFYTSDNSLWECPRNLTRLEQMRALQLHYRGERDDVIRVVGGYYL